MEGTKTKFILVALVVIVIIVASIGFYLIKDAGVEGITAMEGKAIADRCATDWNSHATLITIYFSPPAYEGGGAYAWNYEYATSEIINNDTIINLIRVSEDGTVYSTNESLQSIDSIGQQPLPPSVLDSSRAYQIALDNPDIASFANTNGSAMVLFTLSNSSGIPTWYLDWYNPPHFYYHEVARIEINAITGEVLYVESDN